MFSLNDLEMSLNLRSKVKSDVTRVIGMGGFLYVSNTSLGSKTIIKHDIAHFNQMTFDLWTHPNME